MNTYAIILVIISLGGIAIALWGWQILRNSHNKTKQWPVVVGIIEISEPTSKEDELLPHIVYRYAVNGSVLRSPFEFPSGTNPMPEFAQAYVKKYPIGAQVQVYYNPQQPQQSTIEPSTQGDWMILVLGIMMAVGGGIALLVS